MVRKCLGLGIAGLLVISGSALGHHSDAGRYEETLTTVKGAVVQVQLINPHSMLILEVKDEKGNAVLWRGELGSPAQLKQLGWISGAIKVGDTVTMRGRRLKGGAPYMTLSECARVIDTNGKELFRGNDPGRPATEPGTPRANIDPCASPIK
jgi:uncharacterized protein DUF6152